MLVVLSGTAALLPSTGTVAAASTVTLEITAPQSNEYVQASYALVKWTVNDPEGAIGNYRVFVDDPSFSNPRMTAEQEINLTGLSDGQHSVLVRAYDKMNVGTGAQDSVTFNIDSSAPTLRITSPASNSWLNNSAVAVSWQASSSQDLLYFDARLDAEPWITPISSSQTSNTFQNVSNGQHSVTVVAHAWGGKTSTAVVTFSVDTTIPTVSITYPGDGAGFNHGDITVVWSGYDAGNNIVGYQIWVDGVKVTTAVPGENHFNTNFADGYHTVRIVAYDIANSTAADQATFLIDTVRPSIVSRSPTGDQEPVDTVITVAFSKAMSTQATDLSIDGIPGSMSWEGNNLSFAPTAKLAYGATYHVTLSATDNVGNVIEENWTFATTDMGTVSGVVVDNNGNPLSGVKVSIDGGEYVTTNVAGEFSAQAHAGQHSIVLSKLGYDSKTVTVSLQAGQTLPLGSVSVSPTNPLAIYGVIAAIGAVVIVAVLYFFGRRGKKLRRPQPRSMKGMQDLQRRASKKGRKEEDEEEELL